MEDGCVVGVLIIGIVVIILMLLSIAMGGDCDPHTANKVVYC